MRPFLDPAVDTPLTKGSGDTAKTPCFSAICRTFRSGGTRIRTGDTMIFSHIQKPLGMRKTRIGIRIYVQRVPLDTSWFCPYCCATVDTSFITLQKHSKQNADARSPHSSIGYSRSPPSSLRAALARVLPGVRVPPHRGRASAPDQAPRGSLTSEYTPLGTWVNNDATAQPRSIRGTTSPRGAPPEDQDPSRCDASLPG
jgi:hypothetical protein